MNCLICITVYITKFSAFSKTTFSKRSKKQATKHTEWALLTHAVDSKSVKQTNIYSIRKSLPSLTLPLTKCTIDRNGVWIGKVVEEVLPPQSVAGDEASSAWPG